MIYPLLLLLIGIAFYLAIHYLRNKRFRKRNNTCNIPSSNHTSETLSTQQLLSWIDASTQGWIILSATLKVSYINPKAKRLLNISEHKLFIEKEFAGILDNSKFLETIINARILQRSQRVQWELDNQALDVYIMPGSDDLILILLQSRRSSKGQQQQDSWVSDVAHEIKTPITALMLVADRLEGSMQEKDSILIKRLQKELHRLQSMVQDLLELSRLENNLPGQSHSDSTLILQELIKNAWNSIKPLAEKQGVTLKFLSTIKPAYIIGNQPKLHRAFVNILDNAIRYSPDSSVVETEVLQTGNDWKVTIRDYGQGLSESDLKDIFQRFYRGDPSRTETQRAGSGLGLSITRQIITNHQGRIEARNHHEKGTVIEVLLPQKAN